MKEYLIFFLIRLRKKYNLQLVSYSSLLLPDSDAWSFIGASMQLLKKILVKWLKIHKKDGQKMLKPVTFQQHQIV